MGGPDLNCYNLVLLTRRTRVATQMKLKLDITSATLGAEKFSCKFNSCAIFVILARLYPVIILYSRAAESGADHCDQHRFI